MDNRINNFHLPLVTEQIEIPMENESILGDSNDTKENNNNHHPSISTKQVEVHESLVLNVDFNT